MSEISVVGHADIVETQRGEWWMVLLGVRPYDGFGEPHFNLGRETFMVPVVWESDGWLRVDNDNGIVNSEERLPDLPVYLAAPSFFSDNFESDRLDMRWNTIHPAAEPFWSLTERPGCSSQWTSSQPIPARRQEPLWYRMTAITIRSRSA